jgi:pantetheine-phosphate adenylyltransferase
LDIISRARELFDETLIVIADNQDKKPLFPAEERKRMLEGIFGAELSVSICPASTLLVEHLAKLGVHVIVRGIRGWSDFEYESSMARINKLYAPEQETVFLRSREEFDCVSSSAVRTLAAYGAPLERFVTADIERALREKLRNGGDKA